MRLHQVLTGAANLIEDSVAVAHGNVGGFPFTVYGSGFEIVILDSHFNRVQIISSHGISNSSIVKCMACSCRDGKIAVSFGRRIVLLKPQSLPSPPETKLPFQWKKIATLDFDTNVARLCWDHEGKRLLVGSDSLHIWRKDYTHHEEETEGFEGAEQLEKWFCVWKRKLARPTKFLEFSPDGHYFGSASQGDRMIKIWFRAPKVDDNGEKNYEDESVKEFYNFIYILHPAAVQSLSWRKISPHMPLCSVPNVILTSCSDNVCRIWAETVKYKPSRNNIGERKLTENPRLFRRQSTIEKTEGQKIEEEKIQVNQRYHLVSMFHFHLAAVINPSTDIALLSMMPSSIFGRSFQLQWLNNKEVQLTTAVEAIFASLRSDVSSNNLSDNGTKDTDPFLIVDDLVDGIDVIQTMDEDAAFENLDETDTQSDTDSKRDFVQVVGDFEQIPTTGIPTTYQGQLNNLIHEWCQSSDTLYCIHPADGSLLIWVIDYLDDFKSAFYRQVQVSFASRIPATFSKADASSLCWTHTYHYTQPVQKSFSPDIDSFFIRNASKYIKTHNNLMFQSATSQCEHLTSLQVSFMVSAHADGSLNLWLVTFSESGSFAGIASITHVTRSCGPRFEITQLVSHPVLPLIIGTSLRSGDKSPQRGVSKASEQYRNVADIDSELILWRTSHISPLSEFKGVTEMARISSPNPLEFSSLAWVPVLYHHSLLSITNDSIELLPNTPCACFVAASNTGLHFYQILLDAKGLISNLSHQRVCSYVPSGSQCLRDFIDSEQSGSDSACIMKICTLEKSKSLLQLKFLHIYDEKSFVEKSNMRTADDSVNDLTCHYNSFYVVAICKEGNRDQLYIWSITVSFDSKLVTSQPIDSPDSFISDNSSTPATTPKPFIVSHCLKQSLIYEDFLPCDAGSIKLFASAASLHSSTNLNPTCPVRYNFISTAYDGAIKFWDISVSDESIVTVISLDTLCDLSNQVSQEVLCVSCASADTFAYITKEHVDNDYHRYLLYVKENQSSGELVWSTDTRILVCETSCLAESSIVKLAWMSLENGSYLLAVVLNNIVYVYSQRRTKIIGQSKIGKYKYEWHILKEIKATLKNERVTTISWSNGCFFLIGVENEIQVYSQWANDKEVVFRHSPLADHATSNKNSEQCVILTENSFTLACEAIKYLPQYHPDHLMALLNLGKLRRVRAILRHLVRCVAGPEAADSAADEENSESEGDQEDYLPQASTRIRQRSLSRSYSVTSDGHEIDLAEPVDTGTDIDVIPPLMLTSLYAADKDERGKIMESSIKTVMDRSYFDQTDFSNDSKANLSQINVYFGLRQSVLLTEHLSRKQLPGLSSQEQMYLIALSDTVASTTFDLESTDTEDMSMKYSKGEESLGYSTHGGGGGGYATTGAAGVNPLNSDTVDDCGLRFLLLMRHHIALMKSLPPWQRASLLDKGMLPSEYCWAFHSDCKEELLAMVPGMQRNEPKWSELKSYGVGWWIRSNDLLRRTMEKVAKTHFQATKDPLDCALFYLAMKKKTLISALYRSLRDTKMTTFFNNDFTTERWRRAALKNAYALLGKQRFEHAVAFFLLGNALWDAVQVCINRLNDLQLALVITRLYENDFEQTHRKVIEMYVLGFGTETLHEDPFIRSMALWIMKDYNESLEVLLVPVHSEDKLEKDYDYPGIFSFYYYLRSHPLLRRRCFAQRKPFEKRQMTFLSESINDAATLKETAKKYERKLYFQTAITYLNAGLPSLAFEVLSMLPDYSKCDENDTENDLENGKVNKESDMITTGTISEDFGNSSTPLKSSEMSTCNGGREDDSSIGWGYGAMDMNISSNRFGDLEEEYKIGNEFSDSEDDSDAEETDTKFKVDNGSNGDIKSIALHESVETATNSDSIYEGNNMYDIIALNLKYMCIIQCIIEELKALPAKCTQENKKLRSSISKLLLVELDFLHRYCDYGGEKKDETDSPASSEISMMQQEIQDLRHNRRSETISSIASFDLSAEELSLSEKVEKVAIHSEWLKKNQPILTSLYEHCMMVGSGDADLPAVCLELLFLLHEINDHRVLTAPLTAISAGPSAPPLLLASMASFSLVASPTQFLRSMSHDLLQTVIDLPVMCTPANPVTRLADLENLMYSLSSCVYHSLCGGDEDKLLSSIRRGETEIVGKQMKNGKLVRLPYGAQDVELEVTSLPSQWPGVKFFLSILTASNKDSSHNLKLFLCEAAVAVYLSMFVSACSRLACNILYRFVNNGLNEDMWNAVFGGGTKIVVPAPQNLASHSGAYSLSSLGMSPTSLKLSPNACPVISDKKQDPTRMKWNYKLLGKKANETPDDGQKLFRHELYIPPLRSLCGYIQQKPESSFNYDSDIGESDNEDDDVDDDSDQLEETIDDDGLIDEAILEQKREEQRKRQSKLEEHYDSSCYAWLIMQLSLLKVLSSNLSSFLVMAGLDISDLPTQSPLLYNATKVLVRWEQVLTARLETFPVTESLIDYVPTLDEDGVTRGGLALQRTKILLNQENTPFSARGKNVKPAKRLWYALVQKESLRPIFLHYAFKSSQYAGVDETDFEVISGRILHKDPEPVTSFAINKANPNYLALSTAHEIIEYDICASLETDVFGMGEASFLPEFESVESMKDHKGTSHETCTPKVVQRRPCSGMRRMDSHPHLPYYVAGGADGSVRMFEFLHPDQIAQFRGAGQNDRVNKIHFNALGNKFAVVDDSGYLTMWLITNTQDSTPFLTLRCHTKCCLDFAFLGSSSLIATVGFTNDKRNICIWDTLLPPKKALVHTFSHNIHGAHSLVYVPGQQCLISGGKRGDICIFDIRQRRLLHTFQAHPTVIKVIALGPTEMFFATGSADGDIKIWGLAAHELFESFPKEHSRTTVSLRHHSPGVQCLMAINGGQLFSCGGDGTLKWRLLKIKTSGSG